MSARAPDVAFHVVWLAIATGIFLAAIVLRVQGGAQVYLPIIDAPLPETCMSRIWLGINCPGCGLTRSFISLAHGDWRAAWNYNPTGIYLAAVIATQIPFRAIQLWRIRRGLPEIDLGTVGAVAVSLVPVLLLVQWFERLCAGW